ncbi:hypothetical protein [Siminovitchia fortis]|uniref:hypothetical protein n=1 Tax=Siminovitchia fortis TaxID=254758 RepID=UPI00119E8CAD|nr:hypothetical protein [Siminovitchia fortis]
MEKEDTNLQLLNELKELKAREEINTQLLNEVKEMKAKMEKLEQDIEDIKFFTPKPVVTPAMIGQIGGILLGALVIIGLFWL